MFPIRVTVGQLSVLHGPSHTPSQRSLNDSTVSQFSYNRLLVHILVHRIWAAVQMDAVWIDRLLYPGGFWRSNRQLLSKSRALRAFDFSFFIFAEAGPLLFHTVIMNRFFCTNDCGYVWVGRKQRTRPCTRGCNDSFILSINYNSPLCGYLDVKINKVLFFRFELFAQVKYRILQMRWIAIHCYSHKLIQTMYFKLCELA